MSVFIVEVNTDTD